VPAKFVDNWRRIVLLLFRGKASSLIEDDSLLLGPAAALPRHRNRCDEGTSRRVSMIFCVGWPWVSSS
jgi:hypothetical protein